MDQTGKTILCRAAVAWEPNKPLSVEEVEVAPPKAGEVRIKIHSTAICHSDLFILLGIPGYPFPMILGHEASGTVESVGEGVTSLRPGDRCIPSPVPQCKKCGPCQSPDTNICDLLSFGPDGQANLKAQMADGTTRFRCRGQPVFHMFGCSTFSEYTVCAETSVVKISPLAPLDKVALLGCGVTTGYGAATNVCAVGKGQSVGIWGLGAIGLSAMLGSLHRGAKHIVAVDPNPERREIALRFGATELLAPDQECEGGRSVSEYLREKYAGGLDIAFEASGNHLAASQAFESTRKGTGQTLVLGVPTKELQFRADMLLMGRTIKGAVVGGYKCRDQLPALVEKQMRGELDLDAFVSWRVPLEAINSGIEHMRKCEGIRTLVRMAK